jgi:hypothetical protein
VIYADASGADIYETGGEESTPLPPGFFSEGRGERCGYLPDGRYGPLAAIT